MVVKVKNLVKRYGDLVALDHFLNFVLAQHSHAAAVRAALLNVIFAFNFVFSVGFAFSGGFGLFGRCCFGAIFAEGRGHASVHVT